MADEVKTEVSPLDPTTPETPAGELPTAADAAGEGAEKEQVGGNLPETSPATTTDTSGGVVYAPESPVNGASVVADAPVPAAQAKLDAQDKIKVDATPENIEKVLDGLKEAVSGWAGTAGDERKQLLLKLREAKYWAKQAIDA